MVSVIWIKEKTIQKSAQLWPQKLSCQPINPIFFSQKQTKMVTLEWNFFVSKVALMLLLVVLWKHTGIAQNLLIK